MGGGGEAVRLLSFRRTLRRLNRSAFFPVFIPDVSEKFKASS